MSLWWQRDYNEKILKPLNLKNLPKLTIENIENIKKSLSQINPGYEIFLFPCMPNRPDNVTDHVSNNQLIFNRVGILNTEFEFVMGTRTTNRSLPIQLFLYKNSLYSYEIQGADWRIREGTIIIYDKSSITPSLEELLDFSNLDDKQEELIDFSRPDDYKVLFVEEVDERIYQVVKKEIQRR